MIDYNIKTLDNVFTILNFLTEHQPIGISEIARQTKLSKTTTFRLLKALEIHHMVQQLDLEQYAIGYGFLKYKPLELCGQTLINLAKPYMRDFTKATGEGINLAIKHDNRVYYIHTEVGEDYFLQSSLAPTSQLYCSSMGKIFLSHMPEQELKDYFKQDLTARTHHTLTSLDAFQKEKLAILNKGISYDNEEYEYGLTCISSGLFQDGQLIATIGCSGPSSRLSYKGLNQLERQLKHTADAINESLTTSKDL